MATAVIVDAVRTALGKRNGKLKDWHPVDLAAETLKALVQRNDLDPALVEDVIMGCVMQTGEQGLNIGRNAALAAGFPESVVGTSVDRQCGSSQQSAHFAAQGVIAGAYDVVVAAGVECMTRVPMGVTMNGPGLPFGPQRAARATEEGRFEREIIPITVETEEGKEEFARDQGIRPDSSMESLANLKPAFKPDGKVTAGNSSQITDGAAALLIMSEEKANALGLTPRARFHAFALAGVDPITMLTGPIPSTTKVLERAGMK